MTQSATAISLTQTGKTFTDGTKALVPLDLQVAGGETLVLLGPSGCGKTTLLRLIAGLERPDVGACIRFNDEDVTALPIEKRNVGMVFQSYALFPNMTVRENVAYGLRVRRIDEADIQRRTDEMLEMMHIAELGQRDITQLSGGQRQRVALARAIAVRPRVLLLDEPLTALDALLRERLRVEIDSLLRRLNTTAIYVTHDQAEAMALGDRIVVMNRGRVEQIGSPRDIYFKPASGFVADFIGTINRLPAEIRDGVLHVMDVPIPGVQSLPAGTREVLFRPEEIEIVGAATAHFVGTVESAFFLRDRTRLVLSGVGAEPVTIEAGPRLDISVGGTVAFQLRPDALMPPV